MSQKEHVQEVFTQAAESFTTLKASADRASHEARRNLIVAAVKP